MPYPKKQWQSGEIIYAEDMNDFEDAMADCVDTAESAMSRVENMTATINANME